MPEKKLVYCAREANAFPEDQFTTDKYGTIIHKVGIIDWHYGLTGEIVNGAEGEIPVLPLSVKMPNLEEMMNDKNDWPDIPNFSEPKTTDQAQLELFKAKLEITKNKHLSEIDQQKESATNNQSERKAEFDHYYLMIEEIQKGYIEVSKAAIDRSIQRAEFLQKVAAAVVSLYTAILALTYAADKSKGNTISILGVIPGFFIGISYLLSAFYVSFITRSKDIEETNSDGTLIGEELSQRITFIKWNRASAMKRISLLQASIISLGIGILFLPIPYIQIPNNLLIIAFSIGVSAIILVPLILYFVEKKQDKYKPITNHIPTVELK
jgi:hypothetical protein